MTAAGIVARYAAVARPVILDYFPPRNSCIAASRITVEVLARLGIKAQAVPVSMIVEAKAREMAFVSGIDLKGRAHAVRPSQNGWAGHCIVIAAGHIIDASFDQCDMSDHGVPVEPFILTVPVGDHIKPHSFHAVLQMQTAAGETLDIQYFPLNDWSFTSAPAWELDHLQPAIRAICRLMKKAA